MLDKLKNLFIIEEEDKSKESGNVVEKTAADAAQSNTSSQNPVQKSAEIPKPIDAKPSEKFVNKLLEAIEANNLPGFDYLEFKQAIANLDSVAMDEGMRYQSGMAMAKTMGATPDKLISAAEHYLQVLNGEEEKFRVAFEGQQTSKVQQREEQQVAYEKGIKDREEEIVRLQGHIKELQAKLEVLNNEKGEAMAKVEETKNGFYSAFHIVADQIKSDIELMNKHKP